MCQRTVTEANLCESEDLLKQFWKAFVDLYGKGACTINMHLHGHLTECIRDFGPVYSFWCFSYERMNGILGSYRTNNHHVSVQYMHKFSASKAYAPINWPKEFSGEYLPLLQRFVYHKGSLMQKNVETELSTDQYCPLTPVQEGALSTCQKSEVKQLFAKDLAVSTGSITVHTLCKRTKTLSIGEYVLGSKGSRHSKSRMVLAECPISDGRIELVEVLYYIECVASQGDGVSAKRTKM